MFYKGESMLHTNLLACRNCIFSLMAIDNQCGIKIDVNQYLS